MSRLGLLKTFPDKMPTGSTTANLSILGYDPVECFGGRVVDNSLNSFSGVKGFGCLGILRG